MLCCRAFLDEVVREQVELGYPEWGPPPAPTPTRSSDVQMSPLGGGPGHGQTAGDWQSETSPVQYSSGEVQQQYASTNGNTQYARATAAPAAPRYAPGGQPVPPAAGQGQVCLCLPAMSTSAGHKQTRQLVIGLLMPGCLPLIVREH